MSNPTASQRKIASYLDGEGFALSTAEAYTTRTYLLDLDGKTVWIRSGGVTYNVTTVRAAQKVVQ